MGYKNLSTKFISAFLIASKIYAADIVQSGTTNSTITLSDNDTLTVQGTVDVSAVSGTEGVVGAANNTVTVESTATLTGPDGNNAHGFDFYSNVLNGQTLDFYNSGVIQNFTNGLYINAENGSTVNLYNDGTFNANGTGVFAQFNNTTFNYTNDGTITSSSLFGHYFEFYDQSVATIINNGAVVNNGNLAYQIIADDSVVSFTNNSTLSGNSSNLSLTVSGDSMATVTNNGTISSATSGSGVVLSARDASQVSFTNDGIIFANNGVGLNIGISDTATLEAVNNSIISSNGGDGVYLYSDSTAGVNFYNNGNIDSNGGSGLALDAEIGGSLFAYNNGSLDSNDIGVYIYSDLGATVNFENNGTISNSVNEAIFAELYDGGFANLVNNSSITSSAGNQIYFGLYGGSELSFENAGTISDGGRNALYAEVEDDSVLNILNSGTIADHNNDGIRIDTLDSALANITNTGTISNSSSSIEVAAEGDSSINVLNTGSLLNGNAGVEAEFYDNSTGFVQNDGLINSNSGEGFEIYGYDDSITEAINNGEISENRSGVYLEATEQAYMSFVNTGDIINNASDGLELYIFDDSSFDALNSGTISGNGQDGVYIGSYSSETFIFENTGVIADNGEYGIDVRSNSSSSTTIINNGGQIYGNADGAISFQNGTNTLYVQGFSLIDGLIDGGSNTDTLIFENLYLSADKIAELEALAASDDAAGSVEIYGETFEWQDFEDIQVNNLESIDTLLMDTDSNLGEVLSTATISENPEIFEALTELSNYSDDEMRETLVDNLTGQDSLNFIVRDATNFTRRQNRQFSNHFANVRAGYTGFASNVPKQYDFALPSYMQAGVSEPLVDTVDEPVDVQTHFNDWSGFLQVTGVKSEIDNNEIDSETDSYIATFGLDHRVNNNLIIGAYLGYSYDDARTDVFGSSLDVDGYSTGLYSHYTIGKTFVEGQLGLRFVEYDQERNIALSSTTAHSDFSGRQFNTAWRVGHEINFGDKDKWAFTPQAAVFYSYLYNDGYTESGAGALNLDVSSQDSHSVRSELGFDLARTFNSSWASITPSLSLSWLHEYIDDPSNVNSSFVGSGLSSVSVQSNAPETDFVVAAASVAIRSTSNRDLSFALTFQHEEGNDSSQAQSLSLNARFEF